MSSGVVVSHSGTAGDPAKRYEPLLRRVRRRRTAYLFVLPAAVILLAITIFPLVYELRLVFVSWELTTNTPPEFVGFQNLIRVLFQDSRFWSAMRVTTVIIVAGVAMELGIGTSLALLLNRLGRVRTALVSLFLIPVMIAPVVAGFQFRTIYHDQFGPLNYIIEIVTAGHWRGLAWIADPNVALFSIVMTDVWQWTPFLMLIVLAGLQSIPIELHEAAEVDGASAWQSFFRITMPMLLPVVIIGILIRVMDAFKLFDIVYLVTGGGPGNLTETISFYTYLQGFKFFSLGYTAAMAFIQLAIITLIARFFLGFQKRQRGEI